MLSETAVSTVTKLKPNNLMFIGPLGMAGLVSFKAHAMFLLRIYS